MNEKSFRFGEWLVDPPTNSVEQAGERRQMEDDVAPSTFASSISTRTLSIRDSLDEFCCIYGTIAASQDKLKVSTYDSREVKLRNVSVAAWSGDGDAGAVPHGGKQSLGLHGPPPRQREVRARAQR